MLVGARSMRVDDGGYGGTCTDNQEEGRTGQMTIAPMENEESR